VVQHTPARHSLVSLFCSLNFPIADHYPELVFRLRNLIFWPEMDSCRVIRA